MENDIQLWYFGEKLLGTLYGTVLKPDFTVLTETVF